MSLSNLIMAKHLIEEESKTNPESNKEAIAKSKLTNAGLFIGSMVVSGVIGGLMTNSYEAGVLCSLIGPIVIPVVASAELLYKQFKNNTEESKQSSQTIDPLKENATDLNSEGSTFKTKEGILEKIKKFKVFSSLPKESNDKDVKFRI